MPLPKKPAPMSLPRTESRQLVACWSRRLCALVGAVWAAVACAPAALRVSPNVDSTVGAPVGDISAPMDDVIPILAELLRAWNGGAAPDLLRVVQERLPNRSVVDGSVDAAQPRAPLLLTVSLAELPRCADPQAGVVVGDPPRVLGCGAQALAGLAAFMVAAERHPQAVLAISVDGDRPGTAAARVWSGTGGYLLRGTDGDVFDLEAVDAGAVDLVLARADGDPDTLLVGLGRALAWRSAPFMPRVLADRAALLPAPLVRLEAPITAWLGEPAKRSFVEERCHVEALSLPSTVRMWCQVLPGHTPEAVRDGVLLAIDDPGTTVTMVGRRLVTATGFGDPLAVALQERLQRELPRALVAPWLRASHAGSACDVHRQVGVPCLGGVPLALHPTERLLAGTADDAVDTAELARMAARVTDVVERLVPAASTPPTSP